MGRLEGRVALVTGAAGGIGAATVELFAREGARVAAVDLPGREPPHVGGDAGPVEFIPADVRRAADIEGAVSHVLDRWGRIDVLFNNAGHYVSGPLEATTEAEYDACLDVNIRGVFLGCRAVLPAMKRERRGVILNTASNAGLVGRLRLPVYGAAKGAVVQLTRALAQQVGRWSIRVNCICPGAIATPMVGDLEAARRTMARINPLGWLGEPIDVAHAALFLASDEARYITGVALPVDGGWTAGVREADPSLEEFAGPEAS
jgi:3-oxoacyl-[acyl-carrier protein] reductase